MQTRILFTQLLLFIALLATACGTGTRIDYAARADRDLMQELSWPPLDGGSEASILGDLIDSPGLAALVAEALDANPGLQQTLLTLRIRQAEYRKAGGERLPEISAGYAVGREQGGGTVYTGTVAIGWEVDLWGKLAVGIQAAAMDVAAQQALLRSARDILAAEVMQSWLGMIAAGNNIAIEQQRLAVLVQNETLILQRYRNGLGTLDDLDSARGIAASSRATLEAYRETLAQQQRALRTLLGRATGDGIAMPDNYVAVLLPMADLPEQTLRRRPDLQAAFLAIEAAELRTRVAYKDLLPSINLKAAFEDVATSPTAALLTDPVWSLLAQLTAPLFQGGRRKAAAEIAELENAQSYQAYREILLSAVREIEDAIGLERALTRQLHHVETALTFAQGNLRNYQRSYRSGLADILDLLAVQRQTYDLEIQRNNLIHERLANRVRLGLALGLGASR